MGRVGLADFVVELERRVLAQMAEGGPRPDVCVVNARSWERLRGAGIHHLSGIRVERVAFEPSEFKERSWVDMTDMTLEHPHFTA